jgi:hypothetical protein
VRDGLTVAQACEHTTRQADAPMSAEALQHLRECGNRQKRRIVNDAGLECLVARTPAPDASVLQSDAVRALIRAFGGLQLEDRLVLKLKFCDQLTVADIARDYGLDQRVLYRRINRLLRRLRVELEAQGIDRKDLASWAGEPGRGGASQRRFDRFAELTLRGAFTFFFAARFGFGLAALVLPVAFGASEKS